MRGRKSALATKKSMEESSDEPHTGTDMTAMMVDPTPHTPFLRSDCDGHCLQLQQTVRYVPESDALLFIQFRTSARDPVL